MITLNKFCCICKELRLVKLTARFSGHPTPRWGHNEAATGSLGQGTCINHDCTFIMRARVLHEAN